jgi:hypothetical protein
MSPKGPSICTFEYGGGREGGWLRHLGPPLSTLIISVWPSWGGGGGGGEGGRAFFPFQQGRTRSEHFLQSVTLSCPLNIQRWARTVLLSAICESTNDLSYFAVVNPPVRKSAKKWLMRQSNKFWNSASMRICDLQNFFVDRSHLIENGTVSWKNSRHLSSAHLHSAWHKILCGKVQSFQTFPAPSLPPPPPRHVMYVNHKLSRRHFHTEQPCQPTGSFLKFIKYIWVTYSTRAIFP